MGYGKAKILENSENKHVLFLDGKLAVLSAHMENFPTELSIIIDAFCYKSNFSLSYSLKFISLR